MSLKQRIATLTLVVLAAFAGASAKAEQDKASLHIYSSSKEHLIRPLLEQFGKVNHVDIRITTLGGAAIKTRLQLEGQDTKADMVIVADVANVYALYEAGLLAPVVSEQIANNIPASIRAQDNSWVGVAMRARLIYRRADDDTVQINDYRALTDEVYKGKILVRSSSNPYNQSLLADLIYRYGEEAALDWAKGVVTNMARKPSGGDRDQLRALASGQGQLAIANSYYYAQMLTGEDASDRAYAQKLTPIFPAADDTYATHVNIRGAGVLAASKHKALAGKLLEFLTQKQAQQFFTAQNKEYPANPAIAPDEVLTKIGPVPTPKVNVAEIGKRNAQAIAVFSEAGWK